jgi:hypothetical protein
VDDTLTLDWLTRFECILPLVRYLASFESIILPNLLYLPISGASSMHLDLSALTTHLVLCTRTHHRLLHELALCVHSFGHPFGPECCTPRSLSAIPAPQGLRHGCMEQACIHFLCDRIHDRLPRNLLPLVQPGQLSFLFHWASFIVFNTIVESRFIHRALQSSATMPHRPTTKRPLPPKRHPAEERPEPEISLPAIVRVLAHRSQFDYVDEHHDICHQKVTKQVGSHTVPQVCATVKSGMQNF